MGALANAAALARDTTFADRCLAALVYQAREVIAEPATTPNHDQRYRFARVVVAAPLSHADAITWVMAADSTIAALGSTAAAVPENTLLTRVLAIWDYLASIYTFDDAA